MTGEIWSAKVSSSMAFRRWSRPFAGFSQRSWSSTLAAKAGLLDGVLEWMLALRSDLGLPHTLSGLPKIHRGLGKELAHLAASDPSLGSNPKPCTLEELQSVFEKAFDGDLT